MTATPTQSADSPSVIHAAKVRDLVERAYDALQRVRSHDWDMGLARNTSHAAEDAGDNIAHEVTAAVTELAALALHVDEVTA